MSIMLLIESRFMVFRSLIDRAQFDFTDGKKYKLDSCQEAHFPIVRLLFH